MLCPSDTTCTPCKLTMGIAPIISVAPVMSVAPVISLGALIIINPVTAILGAATQLATIAQNALQTYMQQNSLLSPNIPLPPEVILAERSYYEQRIILLEGLKQEFLSLKKDLEAFRFLKGTHQTTFTYEFLNHINQVDTHQKDALLHISAQREQYLTDKQKENLRFLRETELQRIEQEITSLQTTLVVHINVLIEQVSAAGNECHVFQEKIDQDIRLWNKNLNNITYNTALQLYQTELHQAYLLNSLKQKVDELQMTAHYYRSNVNTSCMEKSTNIFSILEKIDPLITHFNQFITDHKTLNDTNIRVTEKHFIDRGINIQQIRNDIKKNLEQNKNNRAKQAIAQAKNKLENIVVAGSAHPDPDDDKRYPLGIYKDAPYHTSFGNSIKSKAPRNGQKALDNSISLGENTSRRIAISDGEIVILDQTSPRLFHGHVRTWQELTQTMKNVLTDANLVTLKGKIK